MKRGITFISLVIYVGLFFSFTIITSSVTSTLNRNNFKDSGYINVNNNYLKLYSNLFYSCKNSERVNFFNNEYVFSNGDSYTFDKENKLIKKNNSVLCYNFEDMYINNYENVNFNVKFASFDNTINREIVINVGEN